MIRTVEIVVDEAGWRTTLQDLGRYGTERSGVPRGGAADQLSARTANVLVGNPESAPLIESLGGAVAFTADADVLVAATGSVGEVTVDGCPVDGAQPLAVPRGARVRIACDEQAARTYIAFSGLIRSELFLGSAGPDPRMGFAQALTAGSRLELDTAVTRVDQPALGRALFRLPVSRHAWHAEVWTVDLVDGGETDDIPGIRELLAESEYTVDLRSDHVGVRLQGPVLHPEGAGEIVSHGVPIGAVEIPHSDEVIVLGRYRTLTAGYPIAGFATRSGQDLMGQVRPGRRVRFRWTDRRAARAQALAAEAELAALAVAVRSAFAELSLDVDAVRTLRRRVSNEKLVSNENGF